MPDFLLEIGTEELPAKLLSEVLPRLEEEMARTFAENRLSYALLQVYATPRRLTFYVTSLAPEQESWEEEVKGPPASVAFTPQGEPTKAALGFARSQGVPPQALTIKETPAGAYVYVLKKHGGEKTSQVLATFLPSFITRLPFPKKMRWGVQELFFPRPIRWLVALYGTEVVPFFLNGLEAKNISRGHRFLSKGEVVVEAPETYFFQMGKAFVLVDQEKRKKAIWEKVQDLAAKEGGKVEEDTALLEEICYLVEYPAVLCGSFPAAYLELPEEVLVTSMREHQRYFPVYSLDGKLRNKFIAVFNGNEAFAFQIQKGNEKVLRARLADAAFFYQKDLKDPLSLKAKKLKDVIFQEELGNLAEKASRLQALGVYLGEMLGLSPATLEVIKRAAYLAKADLVSSLVSEFPELEGIMGSYYALHEGESPAVAQAIREHYLPRFSGDKLPCSLEGTVLSLTDKLDTLTGYFGIGIMPSGSQDPYGLRRLASGVCALVLVQGLRLPLSQAIAKAYAQYLAVGRGKLSPEILEAELGAFLHQRLENIFAEKGIPYDVIAAVFATGESDFVAAWRRAEALTSFRKSPGFLGVYTAFTRANNLARGVRPGEIKPCLFLEEVETNLYRTFLKVKEEVENHLQKEDYLGALFSLQALRAPVDAFFEGVLVMTSEEDLRQNRLCLLAAVAALAKKVADFSLLVVA